MEIKVNNENNIREKRYAVIVQEILVHHVGVINKKVFHDLI